MLNVLNSEAFACVCGNLLEIWLDCIKIYTDGSLKGAGSAKVTSGAAVYFPVTDMSIGIRVQWVKVKEHSGVLNNIKADKLAGEATSSLFSLSVGIQKHFLVAKNTAVSNNTHYFVYDLFQSVCCACWEAGPGYDIIPSAMIEKINWVTTSKVWYSDFYMLSGFTSKSSANHRQLPVAVRKRLYDVNYPRVLCLLCGKMEVSDHIFVCLGNTGLHDDILANAFKK
ncbi:hypothetical protein G9A89_006990 [Geosiphon pyriformis]|nr:hypothetical protein G9A89_006990 [Geosiphon pyriformis]